MTANPALSDEFAPIQLWRPAIEGHLQMIEHFARAAGLDSSQGLQVMAAWRERFLGCPTWSTLRSCLLAFYEEVVDAQEIKMPSTINAPEAKLGALDDMVQTIELIRAWQALVNLADFILEIDQTKA